MHRQRRPMAGRRSASSRTAARRSAPSSTRPSSNADCLLLFTDGLTEALNPAGEAFGSERVRATLAELAGRREISAVRLADELVHRVIDFVASERLADDLTLVVLRRLP